MTEKKDCPVQEKTCIARMKTLETEIDGIKGMIKASVATGTLILAALEIALRVWRP